MYRIFCSTGALIGRANGRDFTKIEALVPQIECDGFELMFYSDWYEKAARLSGFVSSLGRDFPVLHCDKTIGEKLAEEKFSEAYSLFDINCRTASDIGAKTLVLHLWNGVVSDSNINANFSAYPDLEAIAQSYGLTLTAENVLAHFRTPLTLIKMLGESCPGAKFTYDTKMADFDDENSAAFEEENIGIWKNVAHMHINDRAGAYHDWGAIKALHIGEGNIDFDGFFKKLSGVGYMGDFTVESGCLEPDGRVRTDKMNRSIKAVGELLRKYL